MSTPFSVAAAGLYSLPQEDDIDLASLLITEATAGKDRPKAQYPMNKPLPTFNSNRIEAGSPKRKLEPTNKLKNDFLQQEATDGRYQHKNSAPPVGRSLFEHSSDATAQSLEGKIHDPSGVGRHRNTPIPADLSAGATELFLCRESFLVAADFSKGVADALLKLEMSVDRDGDFGPEVVESAVPQAFDYRFIQGSPKECSVLRDSLMELAKRTKKVLMGLARNQETANRTYHVQLKKMREVCNQSIRSAIQADRAQNGAHLAQMKEMIEVERDRSLADIKRDLAEHQKIASGLKSEIQRLHDLAADKEEECATERRRYDDRVEGVEVAHRQALRTLHVEHEKEKRNGDAQHKEELNKLKTLYEESKMQLIKDHEGKLNHHRSHDDEIRNMLNMEIDRLKAECTRCRDQLIEVTSQASKEREKLLQRFDDEKSALESDFQKSQAESVQSLARIRGEVADRVRKMQEDEKRRQEDFEGIVQKERKELIASHVLNVESLEEKHRKDIRRLEAQLEVRYGEEFAKLRKIHELEVKRLITDNDRLHRSLLAKSKVGSMTVLGGMQQLRAELDNSSSMSRRAQSRAYTPAIAADRVPDISFSNSLYTVQTPPPSSARNDSGNATFSVSEMKSPEADSGISERKTRFSSPGREKSVKSRDESPPPPPPKSPHMPKGNQTDTTYVMASGENADTNTVFNKVNSPMDHSPSTPFGLLRNGADESDEYGYSDETSVEPDHKQPTPKRDTGTEGRIDWGSLQESIDIQEGRRPSPVRPASRYKRMPDSFVLEEALQNAKYTGHNVTINANAVGSYMNRLQDYLEGSEAGDTLSDSSAQRHLNAASDAYFEKYRVQDDGANDASFTSEDSLQ